MKFMRMKSNMPLLTMALVLGPAIVAEAQLQWRVSVKVILDGNNSRFAEVCNGGTNSGNPCDPDVDCTGGVCIVDTCVGGTNDGLDCDQDVQCPDDGPNDKGDCVGDLNTDAEIQDVIDRANAIMDVYGRGRGYRYVLSEPIIDLAGVSQWFNGAIGATTHDGLEAAAEADPVTYAYRSNAINLYILGTVGSGWCSIPEADDGFGDDDSDIIIIGQNLASPRTPAHELGHYLDLCHVAGCPCSGCGIGDCDACNCAVPNDDFVDDTLPNMACWDQNAIATNNFGGLTYDQLNAAQQQQVDFTFFNLMANRFSRERLTPDQLDKMTDASNGVRNNMATGHTRFVDNTNIGGTGTSTDPYESVALGLGAANSGDIVLIRSGSYDETPTINQPVFLRATRGNAIIGKP